MSRLRTLRTTVAGIGMIAALALPAATVTAEEGHAIETVTLPSEGSPLVAIRLMLEVGSIHDPKGKEGLAALTALMVGDAGTSGRTYAELVDALYPMAASISASTDREVTVLSGTVHRDTLAEYTDLLVEAVTSPGFGESDFQRNRGRLEAYLTSTLRSANDELLGLEAIQDAIFRGHPYGHPPEGTVQGLAAITLDDVRKFYRESYTQANLQIGVAGGFPPGYPAALAGRLGALPAGAEGRAALPEPPAPPGRRFTLIEKDAGSVGIHFGYPLSINRADPDFYPLMIANSFLGEHRTFHGRLMQQLRGERGLNYGDYSYIEHWDVPPYTSSPGPGVPRRQQYFSVWIRPVRPETAHFALRAALHEVDRLRERGLTQDELDLTRDFLVNYSKLWAQTLSDRLGFHMDSRFYGMPYYIEEIERRLPAVTVEDVQRVVREHLPTERYEAVLVTDDAAALAEALRGDDASPMTYGSQVSDEVLSADETIERRPVRPTGIDTVAVDQVFETSSVLGGP